MRRFPLMLTGGLAAAGCGTPDDPVEAPPGVDFLVTVRDGKAFAPDSVGAGWIRLRVAEDGAGHILVVFRLQEATDADTFLAALDTARIVTPPAATALGGPEVGDTGDVILELKPGRHVIGCLRRGDDGHRHASTGEAKAFVVTEAPVPGREQPPEATVKIGLADFAFVGPDRWTAGPHLLRVANVGSQDHHLRLDRLRDGVTLQLWLKNEDATPMSDPIAGIARMAPGAVSYLPVELIRGTYVIYCLVPHPVSERPHVELGMVREIQVE